MQDTLIIDNLEQLKALADPLRQRILNALCCQMATTKQVADQLGEKPTRLYHHVDIMEKAGLIELVETRQNRGTVEKYYQAAAHQFIVDQQLLRGEASDEERGDLLDKQTLIVNMLQATLDDVQQAFDADTFRDEAYAGTMVLGQGQFNLTADQAKTLAGKICAWLEEIKEEEAGEDGQPFSMTVVLFPLRRDDADEA